MVNTHRLAQIAIDLQDALNWPGAIEYLSGAADDSARDELRRRLETLAYQAGVLSLIASGEVGMQTRPDGEPAWVAREFLAEGVLARVSAIRKAWARRVPKPGTLVAKRLADVVPADAAERCRIEMAFRRGYSHGFHAARGDFGHTPTVDEVERFREDGYQRPYASPPPHERSASPARAN